MFKSIYARYIVTFMLIIIVSLAILVGLVGAIVSNYSGQTKYDTVRRISTAITENIEQKIARSGFRELKDIAQEDSEGFNALLRSIGESSLSDVTILVVDNSGNLMFSYVDETETLPAEDLKISKAIMDEINNGSELSRRDTLEGLFRIPHFIYASPVFSGENYVCGTVFVCSSTATFDSFIALLVKTSLISSLWVILAALVAIYLASERLIKPLQEMSSAANEFAKGNFTVRVPYEGQDEIGLLAQAFNQMAQSLQSLDEMRNNFMSSVSHDMRTPMTTISGFIDCILNGAIPPEKHEHYLRVIREEVQRLSRLVSTLLDISRIQAGDRKFVMAPFDICEMGRQVLISFEQKIDQKQLGVSFDADEDNLTVCGDHDAIYQIYYNIVDNAVKFSRAGGELRLSIRKTGKGKVSVSVYNEGDGIPYEDQPYIFERFYKSDKSRGKDKTGVGLGMFIAKTIISAHGEEITLNSEPGKNCEFTFTLPLMK